MGAVNALPSNDPGFVVSAGVAGVAVVAFELKAIHFPSLLITGLVLDIMTLTLLKLAGRFESNKTLFVSVIWNIRL